ncbi:MAG: hypothetical protein Q8P22_14230 [Chloroflexota bacterium]|nr:hypothetical protein [Chloroflexota bacterium]
MAREFTKEEVMELVKMARVYAPGLNNERFCALVESEAELADDVFFEAAWALARIAREKSISPIQALDRFQEITKELRDVESAVSQQRQLLAALEGNVYTVRRDLADNLGKQKEVQKARAQEEAELAAFRRAAEKEKQAISAHLAQARERAQVTEQEIVAAGALKADLSRRGLRLGLVLDLSQEIPDDEEAKGRLAAAVERHGSLVADTAHMEKRLEDKKSALAKADKDYKERRVALDELRADEAQQAELRRFHQRFSKLEPLMDHFVTWEEIGLRRCISCGSRFWAEVKRPRGLFYIQRDYFVCPCCGSLHESFDEAAHRAAGLDLNPKARLKFIKGDTGGWLGP